MLPSVAEIDCHVVLKLLTRKIEFFLDNFSGGFVGSLLVDPVLRVLLNFVLIHIAASTVATAVLRQLPKVIFRGVCGLQAAIAVASAVHLNVHPSC